MPLVVGPKNSTPLTAEQRALGDEHVKFPEYMARKLTASRPWLYEDARDAAVDAFIRACRDWEGKGSFTSLAGTYIRHEVFARFKYLKREMRCPAASVFSIDAGEGMSHDIGLVEGKLPADSPDLEGLVTDLPERERLVILLRFRDGQKLAGIGRDLGLTRERVRQIERSGLKKLRLRWEESLAP